MSNDHSTSVSRPHDAIFRTLAASPGVVRDFLHAHMPADIVARCDFSTLEHISGSFVSPALETFISDMVWKVCTHAGSTGYITFILEHQSTPDKLMAFRLLQYTVHACQQHLTQGGKTLPLIIPVVVYHGTASPYPYARALDWTELFDEPDLARRFFHHPFPLVDLSVISEADIMNHGQAALFEYLLHAVRRRDALEIIGDIITLILRNHCSPAEFKAIMVYLLSTTGENDPNRVIDTLTEQLRLHAAEHPEYKEELMTVADYLRSEGRQEGLQEGRQEGLREVALNMLRAGCDRSLIASVTGLDSRELDELGNQTNN